MNVFEDDGYFCVDNLPPEMIRGLVDLFVHEGANVRRAAVVSDVRARDLFETLGSRARRPRRNAASRTASCSSTRTSRRCWAATRRRAAATRSARPARWRRGSPPSARRWSDIKARADFVLDTSGIGAATLRRRIADEFLPRSVHVQARASR